MDDAERSEAARVLSKARWGSTKVDGLIHELVERRDELGAEQLAELRPLVDAAAKSNPGGKS